VVLVFHRGLSHALLASACASALLAAACGQPADGSATPATPAPIVAAMPSTSYCRYADAGADESVQRHGTPCLCCHSDEFGVGGSVDPSGSPVARVIVTAADGDVADMAPDPFANFFRHFPMTPPLRAVAVGPDGRSVAMQELAPTGDCNACHGEGRVAPAIEGP
jgi:hypothetical protein